MRRNCRPFVGSWQTFRRSKSGVLKTLKAKQRGWTNCCSCRVAGGQEPSVACGGFRARATTRLAHAGRFQCGLYTRNASSTNCGQPSEQSGPASAEIPSDVLLRRRVGRGGLQGVPSVCHRGSGDSATYSLQSFPAVHRLKILKISIWKQARLKAIARS